MKESILSVEDDLTFSVMMKTWLGKKGFEVETASNVARARKQLEGRSFSLVLSDLRLPDTDGISLLKWMSDRNLRIPFIIMTGYADIQTAVQAMKNGASDYIAKPVNSEELLKKIGEAVGKKEQASEVISQPIAKQPVKKKAVTDNQFMEGESEAARQLYNYVRLVAPTTMSVLINGAS